MTVLRNVTVTDGEQPVIYGGPFDPDRYAQVTDNFGPRESFDPKSRKTASEIALAIQAAIAAGDYTEGQRLAAIMLTSAQHNGTDFWWQDIAGYALRSLTDGYAELALTEAESGGLGNMVRVRFPERDSPNFFEFFHMRSPSFVAAGARVLMGDQLGQVGGTGLATDPHLHLGLYLDGAYVDCIPVFRAAPDLGEEIAAADLEASVPAEGSFAPPISIHTSTELQYVFGRGATARAEGIVALEEDRDLVVLGQLRAVVPAGKLVRRYTVDVPLMPDPAWKGA